MLTSRVRIPKGLAWGSVTAIALYVLFLVWTTVSPGAYEGAFDLTTICGYILGLPTSFVLDRLALALENAGVDDHLSSLQVALLSVPLNWMLFGAIIYVLRRATAKRP